MGKLIVAVQLPRWGNMLDTDCIQKQLECLCGTFDGWRLEAAPQLPCSKGAVARYQTFIRIPAGAEMLTANRCDGGDVSFVTSSRRKPYLAPHLPF